MNLNQELEAIKWADLILRNINGELTDLEVATLEEWLNQDVANRLLYEEMAAEKSRAVGLSAIERYPVKEGYSRVRQQFKKPVLLWSKMSIAAAILLVSGLAIFFFINQSDKIQSTINTKAFAVLRPGKNRATLKLGDGRVINLSDAKKCIVIDALDLSYEDGTKISDQFDRGSQSYQTITTPIGGMYQIRLADGTRVWLNAASSLRFPLKFVGKERHVELIGEGYFEVAINKKMPFTIKTDRQELQVLGTHFNISSYPEEKSTETTLLEGAVQLRHRVLPNSEMVRLIPGQQAVLTTKDIQVKTVDAEAAVAWKNGLFRFDDEELGSIMSKVARWYNAEVIFGNDRLKKEVFAGIISRDTKISELLKMLGQAGDAQFKIENNRIFVLEK